MTFVGSSLAVDVCGAAEDEDAPGRNGLHQLQGAVPARHAPAEIHVRPVLRWWMNRWDLEHRHDLRYHGNGESYVQWEYMPYFSALYMVGTSNLGSWNGHWYAFYIFYGRDIYGLTNKNWEASPSTWHVWHGTKGGEICKSVYHRK